MRLSVLQENLAKGLSIVGRAVSSRSTLPVLGNVLLSTDDNRLKLAATNLEVVVRTMSMNLKCGRSESNIKGIDASEFPLIPTADGQNALGMPAATLRK